MAWTQDDADTLKDAMATGARDVTYSDGSRVVYRSLAEMRETLGLIQREVAGAGVKRYRTVRIQANNGF